MKIKSSSFLLLCFSALSQPAFSDENNMFVGLGFGSAGIDTKIADDIPIPLSIKAEDNSMFVKGGYSVNQYASVDLTYQKYGDIEFTSPLDSNIYSWDPTSLSINANISYPIADVVAPFVSVGLGYISLNESQNAIKDDSGESLRYGAGVELIAPAIRPLSVVLGYSAEKFTLEGANMNKNHDVTLDSYYVNVNYKF